MYNQYWSLKRCELLIFRRYCSGNFTSPLKIQELYKSVSGSIYPVDYFNGLTVLVIVSTCILVIKAMFV